jgi:hypothetical protein
VWVKRGGQFNDVKFHSEQKLERAFTSSINSITPELTTSSSTVHAALLSPSALLVLSNAFPLLFILCNLVLILYSHWMSLQETLYRLTSVADWSAARRLLDIDGAAKIPVFKACSQIFVKSGDFDDTVLHNCGYHDCPLDLLQLIIETARSDERGRNILAIENNYGWLPLHDFASESDSIDALKLVIRENPDGLLARNRNGNRPLDIALDFPEERRNIAEVCSLLSTCTDAVTARRYNQVKECCGSSDVLDMIIERIVAPRVAVLMSFARMKKEEMRKWGEEGKSEADLNARLAFFNWMQCSDVWSVILMFL